MSQSLHDALEALAGAVTAEAPRLSPVVSQVRRAARREADEQAMLTAQLARFELWTCGSSPPCRARRACQQQLTADQYGSLHHIHMWNSSTHECVRGQVPQGPSAPAPTPEGWGEPLPGTCMITDPRSCYTPFDLFGN